MIKVSALTSGRNTPSSRFRVRQHIGLLQKAGVQIHEYVPLIESYKSLPGWPANVSRRLALPLRVLWQGSKVGTRLPALIGSWHSDITWLQRNVLPGRLTLEPFLKRPMVFDLDDALWLSRPHGTKALQWIASHANAIIAGNSYLAKWLSDYTENIHIIPTAIDTERFTPRPRDIKAGYPFVIGWTGTVTNLPYLENIEEPLLRFLNQYTVAEIRVMADHPPAFRTLPEARIRFVPWSMENEAAFVQQLDVGLMPLPDTKWTRGKCSFKMLQYMACCVPVIVSPVGMNAEVLALGQVGLPAINRDDWYEALANIYEDRTQAQKWGQAGRSVTKQYFSREVIARQLSEVFHRVVEA